jgi:hypothetical protein
MGLSEGPPLQRLLFLVTTSVAAWCFLLRCIDHHYWRSYRWQPLAVGIVGSLCLAALGWGNANEPAPAHRLHDALSHCCVWLAGVYLLLTVPLHKRRSILGYVLLFVGFELGFQRLAQWQPIPIPVPKAWHMSASRITLVQFSAVAQWAQIAFFASNTNSLNPF